MVPKSKKLLKFVLDIGVEERTVLSGIFNIMNQKLWLVKGNLFV